jgi:hypothetical protein
MKKGLWIIPVILMITASCAGFYSSPEGGYPPGAGSYNDPNVQQYPSSPPQYGQNEDSSYFYDRLSPYGNWVNMNPYGYVWTPRHMGYRWRPYSDGHWVWTDYGWTWISEEVWGDIPYHYGRWGMDSDIGWYWVPDNVWGPAWVSWRSNDQYMGWAPLPPGFQFSVGMNFNSSSMDIPLDFWIFIQGSHFQDRYLNPYVLPYERNMTIISYTSIHNNIYTRDNRIVNEGMGIDQVRRITRRDVPRYALRDAQQPGRPRLVGQEIQMFRPNIRRIEGAKPKAYLNRDQALQELTPARVFDPREQQAIDKEAAAVTRRQALEKRLLETSQAEDIKNLQLMRNQEAQRLRNAGEKAKLNKDYQVKISDLQKNHAIEKQQLMIRHKNDTVQVRKVAEARKVKQAPERKKK